MRLVIFLSALAAASTSFCATGREIRFERLGIEHGLSNNCVFTIHQDIRGFMWFGTEDGLNRYDGYQFTVYRHNSRDSQSISINNVPQLFEDRSGTLWICGPSGNDLNRFDRAGERFTPYLPNIYVSSIYEDAHGTLWFPTFGKGLFRYDKATAAFVRYSVANDTLAAICGNPVDDDRTLFIGTSHGVFTFDQREGTSAHLEGGPSGAVTAILGDRAGRVWIGTREGLYSYNCATKICSQYPFGRQIAQNPGDNDVELLYEDREGVLWIGIAGAGIAMFDPLTGKYRHFPDVGYKATWTDEHPICEDRAGMLWVITRGRGLQKYDRRTGSFSTYLNDPRDEHSLSTNLVNAVYEDRSGTLWIGTWGGGLSKIDPAQKAFHHYTFNPSAQKGLTDNVVSGFAEDHSGVLWITTTGGLTKFDRSTELFTHYRNDPKDPGSLSTNSTEVVLEDREGSLWVGTSGHGLERLDPSRKRFTHYMHDPQKPGSLGSNDVLSLCEDKTGGLWIGYAGNDGLLDRLDLHSGTVAHYKSNRLDSSSFWGGVVWAIYEDTQGYIWICSGVGGLNKFDRQTGSFSHYHYDPNNPSSLRNYSVRSFHEDGNGTLWVGTVAGLNKFDRSRGTFVRYSVQDGLESDHLGAILHDNHGCLWMSTSRGISKFDPRTTVFRNYNEDDGVSIHPFMTQTGCRTRNGEMYFGGVNGFVRFHPDSIADNPYVPPIVITKFLISDTLATLDTVITEKKRITLSHEEDSFAFEFASLNYTKPAKNQYAYQLEGFDKDWIYCGTRRYASYTNLEGGSYVFKVRGTNNDGKWNEAGTSISVRILPPYWQTWWFRLLVAIVVIALVALAYNYRVARLLEMERLRVRISSDLHDEIGSNLSAIALQSDMLRSAVSMGDKGNDRLMEISRSARQMANDLRDIVWTINPGLDRLNDMVDRMRIIASTMLGGISYSFRGQAGTATDRLEMEFRRNILLMYKEVLHNIQKHARATEVRILINEDPECFTFTIEDNGVGFDTAIPSSGNGLNNLKRRASSIGATLEIVSAPEGGTRVKIAVRIP
ncbi:MAG: signal transduction histidine kinase [Bacteroidetes bacterium]|nr:signal transduction histidine kinase [Bacteroidota bacterium]